MVLEDDSRLRNAEKKVWLCLVSWLIQFGFAASQVANYFNNMYLNDEFLQPQSPLKIVIAVDLLSWTIDFKSIQSILTEKYQKSTAVSCSPFFRY